MKRKRYERECFLLNLEQFRCILCDDYWRVLVWKNGIIFTFLRMLQDIQHFLAFAFVQKERKQKNSTLFYFVDLYIDLDRNFKTT